MDLGQLPDDCAVAHERPDPSVDALGKCLGNPRLGEWAPRTCAINRAATGQVSTATPRRGIKFPYTDARREVRSRYDTQVARARTYAKSGDLARITQAIEASRCRKLTGIGPISASGRFASVPPERSPSLTSPVRPGDYPPAFRAKCSSVRAGRAKRRFDHCRKRVATPSIQRRHVLRTTSVQAHAIAGSYGRWTAKSI